MCPSFLGLGSWITYLHDVRLSPHPKDDWESPLTSTGSVFLPGIWKLLEIRHINMNSGVVVARFCHTGPTGRKK